jgi:predicted nucleotidyltransferase component of viral defense system
MISAAEIRRLAGTWTTDPTIVERDYVLSWALAALYDQPALAERLVFKGGTALRKCHFSDYRFSADLDFTLRDSLAPEELQSAIDGACQWMRQETGVELIPALFRTLRDIPGEEAHQARIAYVGPLGRLGGTPPRIHLDLTIYETLILPPEDKPIFHPYSDADRLDRTVVVYALDEMLAEKLRAMLRRTRARDLYDVWQLLTRYVDSLDLNRARGILTEKASFKHLPFNDVSDFLTAKNRKAWERSWEASLRHQVSEVPDCDPVIAEVERVLSEFLELPQS